MDINLYFATKNDYKFEEFKNLIKDTQYVITKSTAPIEEIQTENIKALVEDKVIKAFHKIRRPVFVDHTGLYLEILDGFPGGLSVRILIV